MSYERVRIRNAVPWSRIKSAVPRVSVYSSFVRHIAFLPFFDTRIIDANPDSYSREKTHEKTRIIANSADKSDVTPKYRSRPSSYTNCTSG